MRQFRDAIQGHINLEAAGEVAQPLLARTDDIREAQEAWAKLNRCLRDLGPLPPDVLAGWDRIKPWLNQQAHDVMLMLGDQQQTESGVVWKWS